MPLDDVGRRYADNLYRQALDRLARSHRERLVEVTTDLLNRGLQNSGIYHTAIADVYIRYVNELVQARADGLAAAYCAAGVPIDDTAVGEITAEVVVLLTTQVKNAKAAMDQRMRPTAVPAGLKAAIDARIETGTAGVIPSIRTALNIEADERLLERRHAGVVKPEGLQIDARDNVHGQEQKAAENSRPRHVELLLIPVAVSIAVFVLTGMTTLPVWVRILGAVGFLCIAAALVESLVNPLGHSQNRVRLRMWLLGITGVVIVGGDATYYFIRDSNARPKATLRITVRISPSGFPLSVPAHSSISILPLHPYQTFTDEAGYLNVFDNPCGEEHFWPTLQEIASKPEAAYEEVRSIEITNHSTVSISRTRVPFELYYIDRIGGACTLSPEKGESQRDIVTAPTLDPGKTFQFFVVNQTNRCAWVLPNSPARTVAEGIERQIQLEIEPINISGWPSSPFGPTSVKWQGVPTKQGGFGIVRSLARCDSPATREREDGR